MTQNTAISEFKRGWLVLLACFVGLAVSLTSISYYTTGIFMSAFQDEFGWSRTQISVQGLIGVAVITILAPFVGLMIDKLGTRLVAFISLCFYALSFILLSHFTTSLGSFYALSLFAAILAIGTTPITFTRAITGWFDKARGMALGISLVGGGLTGFLAPLFLTPFVSEYGWRAGHQLLGCIIFLTAIIVGILLKDNNSSELEVANNVTLLDETPNSFVSSRSGKYIFVLLALIFFLVATALSGMIVHFIPMLQDLGVTPTKAGQFAAVIGLSVIVGRLGTGVLIDRFFAPRIAAILFAFSAIGYLIFAIGGADFALVAAIAVGLSMGAEVDLIAFLTSRYFKLSSYGKIYGSLYSVFVIGATLSPVAMGYVFDRFGSYDLAIKVSIGSLVLSSALALLLPRYKMKNSSNPTAD